VTSIRRRFDVSERGIIELAVLDEEKPRADRLVRHLEAIYWVSTLMNSAGDLGELLDSLAATIGYVFESERSYVIVNDEHGVQSERVVHRSSLDDGTFSQGLDISSSIVGEAIDAGQSVLTADAQHDGRFKSKESVMLHGIRSVMCVPVEASDAILGALYVDSGSRRDVYGNDDLELLASLGRLVGLAVHRAFIARKKMEAERNLHRREEEVRQLQKLEAIGRLAGGVAHDFNNLLAVISGYCDLVLDELGKHPLSEHVVEVRQAAERATELTSQLLAFSRKQIREPTNVDLNTLISGMKKMLGRLIGEDVVLKTVLHPGLGHVLADKGQVQQVVMNLAVNARDAMPTGGKLTIETSEASVDEALRARHPDFEEGRYAMLAITDTGVGIDHDTQSRIFEPFFTTKDEGKGTGLGLSTVYGIVKQSGGEIIVYSEVGQGTTFKIYLPLVSEGDLRPSYSPRKVASYSGTETILVAEDDEALLKLTSRLLRMQGYQVLEASSGEDAISIMALYAGKLDMLVTDVVMPGMSGSELARFLQARRPGLKVLYMSGYPDDAIFEHGVIGDGMHFVQKPFTAASIGRKVREVLDD
jgi:signal transduction histidine kinase/CheY-like chemotaxis protein